jgi:hypothetical protein
MTLDDDERRQLAEIEDRLHASDPTFTEAFHRQLPRHHRWPKISIDTAVAVGLIMAMLAAIVDHHLFTVSTFIIVTGGIWLASRSRHRTDRKQ